MTERLVRTIRNRPTTRPAVDSEPASVYEIITRQMVTDLARDLRDLRRRIDALLFVVLTAIIADIVMRLTGAGS